MFNRPRLPLWQVPRDAYRQVLLPYAVLLTVLQSSFEADPLSSGYVLRPALRLTAAGTCAANPAGRPIRVCQRLDTALLLSDFLAKLALPRP